MNERKSYPLRMPSDLKAELTAMATAGGLPLHAEILVALRQYVRAERTLQAQSEAQNATCDDDQLPVVQVRPASHRASVAGTH
jgi:hypothetical protein